MSLFGFPSGLSGGSKETEYLTEYTTTGNTLKSTNYGNTSYSTTKSTTRSTGKSLTAYYSGLDKELFLAGHPDYQGMGGCWFKMESGAYLLKFYYASSETDGYLTGSFQEGGARVGFTNGNGGIYTSSSGQDPSVNVGKYVPYRNNGLMIGTHMGNWYYALKITSSAPYPEWRRVIDTNRSPVQNIYERWNDYSAMQFTANYTGNTSYQTHSHNTSRDTYNDTLSPTSFGTDYQTAHITYG